ncbi:MAG: Na/Pi symporter, partial [Desulfuromonadales bacterium]
MSVLFSQNLIFGFIGGLGLFLFGMKIMSEGLQKVAGDRMRQILGALTNNRIIGTLVGLSVTAIIQSSSATTVMVVGFVNTGLMSLVQSIG